MGNGHWNDGMGGGNWWWMVIMMFAILGGLIWIGITLIRHGNHNPQLQSPVAPSIMPPKQTPQEVLAERLARGEIDPDDYRQRLDALQHRPNA